MHGEQGANMRKGHGEIEALLADHLEAELGDAAIARASAAAPVEDALSLAGANRAALGPHGLDGATPPVRRARPPLR